ncbi:UDP-GlcNAc:betaGal beta-1,3-N-acetylglucosaminyltransferase-like protein 1 [Hyposmocoma kahamanoa]|uniref:UDP-GlcNAc:betaGal beta-1,3-N-acetylglucosaminyltransferase-like protein 1 n=1 Tax=Hyposmocoma kahamanoa TaxID=1477025 RepID=UPI000E6D9560|nr:UDP-GlcNAc:betaGal beta-1,3-N-acetylglucosaminyltransferase-like protein 1 [Hyposmocoma kahamanoa]
MFDISIIIPVYNGEKWIDNCMKSIATQTIHKTETKIEIVVHDDGSSDNSQELLENWCKYFSSRNVPFVISKSVVSKGVGSAKNAAVERCSGEFLCFQDIDDVMLPNRILLQYEATKCNHKALTGSKISRQPLNSTPRLVRWANNLTKPQLKLQIYTSNGPTLLMPTWFCHRSVYDRVGGFVETGIGTPEDLIFFNAHIDAGGDLHRVDETLVIYTYHESAATLSVKRECIWKIQLNRLEKHVLSNWEHFTIWNAGKAGRKLVRSLNPENLKKVQMFCDVDANKIGRVIEFYSPTKRKVIAKLPVIHFSDAKPPLLICVKLDLTNGEFEHNLKSLNLIEGTDYVIFS